MSLNDGIDRWNWALHWTRRRTCHPLHTKRTFPFSLALRIRSICSTNETFKLRCDELAQACTIPLLTWIQSRSPQPGVFTSCRIPPSRVLSTVGFIVVWGGGGGGGGWCPGGRRPRAFLGDPEIFCNKYALRCNLVHFETRFWEMLVCALTSSRLDDFSDIATYVMITI